MIVAVLVVGKDAEEPLPHHLDHRVLGVPPRIGQQPREPGGVAPSLVELPQGQQPRVAGHRPALGLDHDRSAGDKVEGQLICSLLTHPKASVRVKLVVDKQVTPHGGFLFQTAVNNAG